MSFWFKQSACFPNLSPQMVLAAMVVKSVFDDYGEDCIITSANDSKHGDTSLHYAGEALDFRTRHLSVDRAEKVAAEVRKRLTRDFDVVLEPRKTDPDEGHVTNPGHLHVEHQPRRP